MPVTSSAVTHLPVGALGVRLGPPNLKRPQKIKKKLKLTFSFEI